MAQRRFGPTLGAGVSVTEREAQKAIAPGALGVTGFYGVFEKGPVGELVAIPSKKSGARQMGTRIPDSLAPDALLDFWDMGQGAGFAWAVRVTDGTEVAATIDVFGRTPQFESFSGKPPLVPVKIGSVSAKNGGTWGGKERILYGLPAGPDIQETTLDTHLTLLEDELVGGVITYVEAPQFSYLIVSNDIAGVVTIGSDQQMLTEVTPLITNGDWRIDLPNGGKALSVLFKDGTEQPSTEFGMEVFVDGAQVLNYENLSTDPNSSRFWEAIVNEDGANSEVTVDHTFEGTVTSDVRPSNYGGAPTSVTSTRLNFVPIQEVPLFAGNRTIFSHSHNWTDSLVPDALTVKFTSATAFDVFSEQVPEPGGVAGPIATGTLSGSPDGNAVVVAASPYSFGFTIQTFGIVEVNDEFQIFAAPLSVDALAGGFLYPDALNPLTRRRISGNAIDHIDVDIGSELDTVASALTQTVVEDVANAGPDEASVPGGPTGGEGGVDETWSIEVTLAGVYATAEVTITRLSDMVVVLADHVVLDGESIEIAPDVEVQFDDAGASAFVLNDSWLYTHIAATQFRVESPFELGGGYDGLVNLGDADFLALMTPDASPFKELFGKNQGLVKLSAPGVTSTAVQKAGLELASALNYQWRITIPANIVTEIGAHTHINETIGRSDYGVTILPSFAYVVDQDSPDGRLKLVDQTGAIQGREALVAKNFNGYHKAAAGTDVTLPSIIKLPTGDTLLNEEFLNPTGINVIKFKSGNAIIWGDRTVSIDPAWKFKHQREQMSYYENILREQFDFIVFAINDVLLRAPLLVSMQTLFLPEFVKRAIRGDSFQDAIQFKIDDENNTDATLAEGDTNMDITLRLADTVERFNISIGKAGIFDSVTG